MEYTNISGTSIESSRIGLGTWAIGGCMWSGSDEKEAIQTIHAALDQGINLIDTAPAYGFGQSEEIVGKAVQQYGERDRVILATKSGRHIRFQNGSGLNSWLRRQKKKSESTGEEIPWFFCEKSFFSTR